MPQNHAPSKSDRIVIVCDDYDDLASHLVRTGRTLGVVVEQYLPIEAAAMFEVIVSEEGGLVSPDVPILIRPMSQLPPGLSEPSNISQSDDAFRFRESLAHLNSVYYLVKSTVINRPSLARHLAEFSGNVLPRDDTLVDGAEVPREFSFHGSIERFREWFPQANKGNDSLDIQRNEPLYGAFDYMMGTTYYLTADRPISGTVRLKSLVGKHFNIVIVVGASAWSLAETGDMSTMARQLSIALVSVFNLSFAAVYWSVDEEREALQLTKISPSPSLSECGPHADAVILELLTVLTERKL